MYLGLAWHFWNTRWRRSAAAGLRSWERSAILVPLALHGWLIYGGVFRIKNVPENQLAPLLLVECPRLIFPFARQVLATVTQQGGFPPLMMEPVDFNAIYLQNLKQLQAQQQATAAGGGTPTPTPTVTN